MTVVVGSGVVGVVAALRLAERGARVTLVDASVPGSGTSGTTFAHVNASYAGYWDYVELRAAGVAGYRRLRDELGSAPWLLDAGFLQFDARPRSTTSSTGTPIVSATPATRWRACGPMRCAGWSPTWSSRRRRGDLLLPGRGLRRDARDARAPAARGGAAGCRDSPERSRGGLPSRGRPRSRRALESGERIATDLVVCCCGRWTDEVLALAGLDVPSWRRMTPGPSAGTDRGVLARGRRPEARLLRRRHERPARRRWTAHAVVGRPRSKACWRGWRGPAEPSRAVGRSWRARHRVGPASCPPSRAPASRRRTSAYGRCPAMGARRRVDPEGGRPVRPRRARRRHARAGPRRGGRVGDRGSARRRPFRALPPGSLRRSAAIGGRRCAAMTERPAREEVTRVRACT